jgi:hypothetical protein
MSTTYATDDRSEARELGLRWRDVLDCARELRRQALQKRETMDGARRLAWENYCHWNGRSEGCHSFWRCGFDHVLGRLADSGRDYTSIRNYDVIADSVAEEYPEWSDQCGELWDWLSTPHERLPAVDRFVDEAIAMLHRMAKRNAVPF